MSKLTTHQEHALAVAKTLGERFTCAQLGEALYAEKRFASWKVWPSNYQRFARPGGKVMAALQRANKVTLTIRKGDRHVYWRIVE